MGQCGRAADISRCAPVPRRPRGYPRRAVAGHARHRDRGVSPRHEPGGHRPAAPGAHARRGLRDDRLRPPAPARAGCVPRGSGDCRATRRGSRRARRPGREARAAPGTTRRCVAWGLAARASSSTSMATTTSGGRCCVARRPATSPAPRIPPSPGLTNRRCSPGRPRRAYSTHARRVDVPRFAYGRVRAGYPMPGLVGVAGAAAPGAAPDDLLLPIAASRDGE